VLDDVSPCDVNLGIALRSLLDSGDGDPDAASLPALIGA
jgi:hypothetical protein